MNEFLQQRYSQRPNSPLLGTGLGTVLGSAGGAGLGALFSKLTGAAGPLPAIAGGIGGGLLGLGIGGAAGLNATKQFQNDNVTAFNQLDPQSQQQAMQAWAAEMDAAAGDGSFSQMLRTDPQQFKQLMLQVL